MKNRFHHHLESFINFPLIYRFAGIRRVITELEADKWKHRSNYTVSLIERRLVNILAFWKLCRVCVCVCVCVWWWWGKGLLELELLNRETHAERAKIKLNNFRGT